MADSLPAENMKFLCLCWVWEGPLTLPWVRFLALCLAVKDKNVSRILKSSLESLYLSFFLLFCTGEELLQTNHVMTRYCSLVTSWQLYGHKLLFSFVLGKDCDSHCCSNVKKRINIVSVRIHPNFNVVSKPELETWGLNLIPKPTTRLGQICLATWLTSKIIRLDLDLKTWDLARTCFLDFGIVLNLVLKTWDLTSIWS